MSQFHHGVKIEELNGGTRPITTGRSTDNAMVGTAPNADANQFPIGVPVQVTSVSQAAALGIGGTLPDSIRGFFDNGNAAIAVIRVEQGGTAEASVSNVINGIDQCRHIKSELGLTPRIITAPGFSGFYSASDGAPVMAKLVAMAEKLAAIAVIDGPGTTDADAIKFAELTASARAYIVEPGVKVWDNEANTAVEQAASARVAGRIAWSDAARGFWWSPSNTEILNITGTARPMEYDDQDPNCAASLLDAAGIATIINDNGYRLWGNRTRSNDPKWAFLAHRRTADMINDALRRAHKYAVDSSVGSAQYFTDIVNSVNEYFRTLKQLGAIVGGTCWADPDLNSPTEIQAGRTYFDFDFTPPGVAESITFRSRMVNDYYEELF